MNHSSPFHISLPILINNTNKYSTLSLSSHFYLLLNHSFALTTYNHNRRLLTKTSVTIVTSQSSSQRRVFSCKTSDTIVTFLSSSQKSAFPAKTLDTIVTFLSSPRRRTFSDQISVTIVTFLSNTQSQHSQPKHQIQSSHFYLVLKNRYFPTKTSATIVTFLSSFFAFHMHNPQHRGTLACVECTHLSHINCLKPYFHILIFVYNPFSILPGKRIPLHQCYTIKKSTGASNRKNIQAMIYYRDILVNVIYKFSHASKH
jgi:hypothetical protein